VAITAVRFSGRATFLRNLQSPVAKVGAAERDAQNRATLAKFLWMESALDSPGMAAGCRLVTYVHLCILNVSLVGAEAMRDDDGLRHVE
jgi:hypothetical protein